MDSIKSKEKDKAQEKQQKEKQIMGYEEKITDYEKI